MFIFFNLVSAQPSQILALKLLIINFLWQ